MTWEGSIVGERETQGKNEVSREAELEEQQNINRIERKKEVMNDAHPLDW